MIEKALTKVSAFLFNPNSNSQQNQKSIHYSSCISEKIKNHLQQGLKLYVYLSHKTNGYRRFLDDKIQS